MEWLSNFNNYILLNQNLFISTNNVPSIINIKEHQQQKLMYNYANGMRILN